MLTTLKSLLSSALSSTAGKCAFYAILAMAIFGMGVYVSSLYYKAKIADLQTQSANVLAEAERDAKTKLKEAVERRDDALHRLDSMRSINDALLKRMRVAERRASRASADRADNMDERLDRCRGLLLEGSELSASGCRLLGRCQADRSALGTLLKN